MASDVPAVPADNIAEGEVSYRNVLNALRESEGRLSVVLQRLHNLVLYETGGGREYISPNVIHLLGYSAEQLAADRDLFLSIVHPEEATNAQAQLKRWQVQGSVGELLIRFRVRRRDGHWIWIEDRRVQIVPGEGQPYMTGVLVDVTDRLAGEEQWRVGEERSNALLAALPDNIFLMDRDGVYLDYHVAPGARLMVPPEQFLGRRMSEVMVGPDVEARVQLIERTLETGNMHIYEYEIGPPDDHRHYEVRMVPCGRDRVLSIVRNITNRKRAEQGHRYSVERQRLMLSELDHRIRNNLAALISLIDVTAASDAPTVSCFAATLRSRVAAMAGVHTLLSRVQWSPARLQDLLRATIPPDLAPRVELGGPEVRVSPRQAIPLAMALQELLFNGIKYGALSVSGGTVAIAWRLPDLDSAVGDVSLEMRWRELGGPSPAKPPRLGAGTSLLTGLVSSELRGRVELSFPVTGADHLLTLGLDRV